MVGKQQQRDLSVQVSPHSHPGLYWLSPLFRHKARRSIWREKWKLSLCPAVMTETLAFSRARGEIGREHTGRVCRIFRESGPSLVRIDRRIWPRREGEVGIIGRRWTSDGQQFIMFRKPSIIIGQTAVWSEIFLSCLH